MSKQQGGESGRKIAGIRLNYLNFIMICLAGVIAVMMVISTYQTTGSVQEIVQVTDDYLANQQTGGMLRDFSGELAGLAEEFVKAAAGGQDASGGGTAPAAVFLQNGGPRLAGEYAGKLGALNEQLDRFKPESFNSESANQALADAISAFRHRNEAEIRAMRLAAADLPRPASASLPQMLQTGLSEEEQALEPEEKMNMAKALLSSESYIRDGQTIRAKVDESHRLSSLEGEKQAADTFARVNGIMTTQKILVFLLIAGAAAALVLNRALIISPMKRSVEDLDRREPIRARGSYEMRRLAEAYNAVRQENEEKTAALSYTATHDPLTDALNRAAFDMTYREEKNGRIAVLVADIDYFKQYNDEFGHDIGDRVLQMAADALKRHFREEDRICRIGGDEFCIIMPGVSQDGAGKIRDEIIRINEELKQEGTDLPPVTLTAGIACWDRPNPQGSIFKDADRVLLELKKKRDSCCAIYQG